jgi:hypothetical protein
VQHTLEGSAKNSWQNQQATPIFHAGPVVRESQRSERGTFWTILLQIELEEVNLRAAANTGL